MLAGGITLVESWEIAAESITNRELRRAKFGHPADDSRGPVVYRRAWRRRAGFRPLALDMIGIGERSGSLREMLEEVAVFYDAESEVRLGTVDDDA